MTSYTIQGASYELVDCCSCGVKFLIPAVLESQAQQKRGPNGRQIYCPNGHNWHYVGETEADKLRRERDRLRQDNARLEEERIAAERAAERAKKETARLKKRAAGGVCPCCNRHFTALERHMKTQHPNVVSLEAVKA